MPIDNPILAPYVQQVEACAADLGIDPLVIFAMILVESSGNPNARNSSSGATGLLAIMPREAGHVFRDRPTSQELLDPTTNIEWGCRILGDYLRRENGDIQRALMRYSGFANRPWDEFINRYWAKIEREIAKLRTQEEQPIMGTTTERFIKAAEAEFGTGFEDLRRALPDQGQGFKTIDSRQMPNICLHHSATPINTTARRIWEHHTKTNGWAGTGYHVLVRLGRVLLVGDLDTQRAHVKGLNHLALGICVVGSYDMREVPPENIDALKRLIRVLDSVYSHQKQLRTHGGAPPLAMIEGYTSCPGSAIKAIIPTLRTLPPSTPKLPDTLLEKLRAVLWSVEEGRREFARGMMAESDNRYRDLVEHPLKQLIQELEGA